MIRRSDARRHTRWTTRTALVAAAMVVFVIAQVVIAAVALTEPRPARFGWQMYTAVPAPPTVHLEAADGRLNAVDLEALMARGRADADLSTALADHLCTTTDAAAVLLGPPADAQRVPCP